jgi:hypothetical protein
MFALEGDEFGMRDSVVGGEESGREGSCGVGTGELPRFGGGEEELFTR